MSTKISALFAYGLHLTREDCRHMHMKHFHLTEAPDMLYTDILNDLYEAGLVDLEFSFTGEAVYLDDHGRPEWGCSAEAYYADPLAYVCLPETPTLLKAPYTSMDEAARDMQLVMEALLPDDFNYRDNLCLICGTYYG